MLVGLASLMDSLREKFLPSSCKWRTLSKVISRWLRFLTPHKLYTKSLSQLKSVCIPKSNMCLTPTSSALGSIYNMPLWLSQSKKFHCWDSSQSLCHMLYMRKHIYAHVCGGPKLTSGVMETGSLIWPGTHGQWVGWLVIDSQRFACLCLPSPRVICTIHHDTATLSTASRISLCFHGNNCAISLSFALKGSCDCISSASTFRTLYLKVHSLPCSCQFT